MTEEMLTAALALLAAGFAIIPLSPGSKLPATKWKPYQTVRPTVRQLETWFAGTRNNIALVMGAVSDNAVALDFDDRDLARFAFDLEKLALKTFVQETPRGFHVVVRTEGGPIKTTSYVGRGVPLDVPYWALATVTARSAARATIGIDLRNMFDSTRGHEGTRSRALRTACE